MTNTYCDAEGIERLLRETAVLDADAAPALTAAYVNALLLESLTLNDALTIRDLLALSALPAERRDLGLHRLLIALCASRNRGSLCVPLDGEGLAQAVHAADGESLPAAEVERIRERLASGAYAGLICGPGEGTAPLVYVSGAERLYFQRYHAHESRLQDALLRLASRGGEGAMAAEQARALALAASRYRGFEGSGGGLNSEQLRGVYLALRNHFTIVSGGPGTGKTTLVTSILRALVQGGIPLERIHLVAPTGRAGQRLGEAIQVGLGRAGDALDAVTRQALGAVSGSTIHRLLRYNPGRHQYTYGPGNPLPADVVICDEVSMVDVVLMDRLLAALGPATRVVFLGDRDQLPSVDAGAVFGDLIPRQSVALYSASMARELAALDPDAAAVPITTQATPLTDRIVLLTQSHRAQGAVLEIAGALNRGAPGAAAGIRCMEPPLPGAGAVPARAGAPISAASAWEAGGNHCRRLDPGRGGQQRLKQVLVSWSDWLFGRSLDGESYRERVVREVPVELLPAGELGVDAARQFLPLFDLLAFGQILTVTRHGALGCDGVNAFLSAFWRDRLDPWRPRRSPLFAGAPLLITRNDYRRNLFNGDSGILLRATSGRYHALFRRGASVCVFPLETLPRYELAFAMTVHKSQGSEYGNVLLLLPAAAGHPLLSREIVYTGLTRTRGNAFVFGTAAVLQAAAERRIERQSGIDLWRLEDAAAERNAGG